MSKIKQKFLELNAKNEKALIPFITAGDPDSAQDAPGATHL